MASSFCDSCTFPNHRSYLIYNDLDWVNPQRQSNYKVFAKWSDDGALWQAFVASVRHLAAEKQLDRSVLHGDGTNTVAKKGGWDRVLRVQTPEGRESHRD